MGYSVKWIKDHLGISKTKLLYYEKAKLLSSTENRNPLNQYRDYDEADIEKIWMIRFLNEIGFTASEIKKIFLDKHTDFLEILSKKIEELEKKQEEKKKLLQFLKTAKLTGRMPILSELGTVRFDDFMKYARENWNLYENPLLAMHMKTMDTLVEKPAQDWTSDQVEHVFNMFKDSPMLSIVQISVFHSYCKVISEMTELEYNSNAIQKIVRLLYQNFQKIGFSFQIESALTPQMFARYVAPLWITGDLAAVNERNYGKEGCLQIARAIAFFGGYDDISDL